ncbi:MAG: hypothetical protein LBK76_06550 [Verrucomicrobiales bacterium]|jgi:beta-lactamase regulating signal transducer with metallopeptidase domain/ankyrin repeat protein|nr:hypothetical protein [Verrucomicrobiales bacterium]
MRTAILNWLIETSWQASLLVALVVVAQLVFRRALSARWRYLLWLIVVGRLLLPTLPESPTSVYRYVPAAPTVIPANREPAPAPPPLTVTPAEMPPPRAADLVPTPAPPLQLNDILFAAWLTVGALLALMFVWRNFLLFRRVSTSATAASPRIQTLADRVAASLRLGQSVPVREFAGLDTPAVVGLPRPVLLLPKQLLPRLTDSDLESIFRHELAHVRRGDLWMNLLCALLQIVHWFNPLLWWAFARLRHDRELATDALAASAADRDAYGQTLIKLSAHRAPSSFSAVAIGILENHRNLRQRIEQIAKLRANAYAWSFLGVALLIIVSVLCLTKFTPEKLRPFSKDIQTQRDLNGSFYNLLAHNHVKEAKEFLQRGLIIPNTRDNDYLYWAIKYDHADLVKLLFKHGCQIREHEKQQLINLALERANRAVTDTLTVAGIKFDPLNYAAAFGDLKTLGKMAQPQPPSRAQWLAALCFAAAADQLPAVNYLLGKCAPLTEAENKRVALSAANQGRLAALRELDRLGCNTVRYVDEIFAKAVYLNKPEILNYLYDQGAVPSAEILSRNLDQAAARGHLESAAVLLSHGADPNLPVDNWKRYPIISAASPRYYVRASFQADERVAALVQLLLAHGANADAKNEDNRNAAWFATSSPKVLRLLLDHGATVNGTNSRGNPLLFEMIHVPAAFHGDFYSARRLEQIDRNYEQVIDLLVKAGANVNQRSSWQELPLSRAIRAGNLAIATGLINNGADIHAADDRGNTPLALTTFCGFGVGPSPRLTELLLAKGANPNDKFHADNDAWLTLTKALAKSKAASRKPADQFAATHEVIKILLKHGSLITDGGNPAAEQWLQAAATGDLAALKQMRRAGQPIDTADQDGWTALTLSLPLRHKKVTQWLLANGVPLTTVTKDGFTPILCAVGQNDKELVARILQADAAIGKKQHITGAIDLALNFADHTVFRQLLAAGFPTSARSIYRCIVNGAPASARLLFERGTPAEADDNPEHRENVYWAIDFNQPEILQMILDHGGDPTRKTTYDETPLSRAKQFHPEMVPVLEAAIAKRAVNSKTKVE